MARGLLLLSFGGYLCVLLRVCVSVRMLGYCVCVVSYSMIWASVLVFDGRFGEAVSQVGCYHTVLTPGGLWKIDGRRRGEEKKDGITFMWA
ncbi:hypothetical protein HOY82DRAFT_546194 [Tuber indicum]|nr:hypothetical protein HOY82DRAFT_546194 [Tuber indicum]